MKSSVLFLSTLFAVELFAQKPAVDDVLNTERSFAAFSVEHRTKAAFLHFLDSNSVVFEAGKAVNGLEAWKKKKDGEGVLNWRPVYGLLSSSGDLGFTTGPWTFQPKTVRDSIVACGQYSTVWKKNGKGEWKVLVDLGNSNQPAFDDALYTNHKEEGGFVRGTWNNLLNKDEGFAKATSAADTGERRRQYEKAVSKNAFFLNRNGNLPVNRVEEINRAVTAMPDKIEYTIQGSGISSAGDLGYVYGSTVINNKAENYLRIWRREGKEWKLALEVLRY